MLVVKAVLIIEILALTLGGTCYWSTMLMSDGSKIIDAMIYSHCFMWGLGGVYGLIFWIMTW